MTISCDNALIFFFVMRLFYFLVCVVMQPLVNCTRELPVTVGHAALLTAIIKILVIFVVLRKTIVISQNIVQEILHT